MKNESSGLIPPPAEVVAADVRRALAEDIGAGDVTAELIPAERTAHARVISREAAVLCGRPWFDRCFLELAPRLSLRWHAADGDWVTPGSVLCELQGQARALVSAERTALNFLQLLSGTATTTAAYVEALRGSGTTVLDTRKTLPGLRAAQKYAVRAGGGSNHRQGLHDAILIKENHITACGSISAAVAQARALHPELLVETEVENFDELRGALAAAVDRVMLDEFALDDLQRAVREVAGRCEIEVSGSVSMDDLRAIAQSGVDFVSIGALTKHVRAIDLSMRVELGEV